MSDIQETERTDYIMPYLQDLVRQWNEREVEWVESEERMSHESV